MKRKSSFLVTASSMTRTDFRLAHPLVTVRPGSVVKFDFEADEDERGKVLKINKVDLELLDYFMQDHLYPAMQKAAWCYRRRTNENKISALASAFFPVFTFLSPRASDADLLRPYEQGDPLLDSVNEIAAQEASSSSGEQVMIDGQSREKLEWVQEDGADLGPRQAVDFRGYASLIADESSETNESMSILICDAKQKNFIWEPDTNENSDLYQLCDYTCCAAVPNIDSGRFKPIHMLVLADGDYGVAVLHVEGYLEVGRDNVITDAAFDVFLGHMEAKENKGDQWKSLNDQEKAYIREKYQITLNKSRLRMQKLHMVSDIPVDRKLVVGEINFYPLARIWTKFPIAYPSQRWSTDDYIFIAGMLRVLFGDRVLLWKKQTLEAIAASRNSELVSLGRQLPIFPPDVVKSAD
ncbi:hypothetical protein SELMODRAFT_439112 [Selaginella moellendorffii]|uniref:Uncharacterized protein n=1 Tax=Selaginella moellendorffii TaxID=88036 RepID=D8R2J6_SELML|nr:uncharacterized protein LOC9660247 [Selaginella moellendorffii]EFJ33738.1 hypothetical protein SELMODRAFT_439112 [Selaginella moellendorffii]|eukprot:XP_002964900.1 uncharacterized protein LOC9660247 [Selaginella moellendorffii]